MPWARRRDDERHERPGGQLQPTRRSAACSRARGASSNPFTFVGQSGVTTDGSGLYSTWGRGATIRSTGQFITTDPIVTLAASTTAYAANSPVNVMRSGRPEPAINRRVTYTWWPWTNEVGNFNQSANVITINTALDRSTSGTFAGMSWLSWSTASSNPANAALEEIELPPGDARPQERAPGPIAAGAKAGESGDGHGW